MSDEDDSEEDDLDEEANEQEDDGGNEVEARGRTRACVSFLCEKKSLAMWKGAWSGTGPQGRGIDGITPLQTGNATIEVDERHVALDPQDDGSRLLRPIVRRVRT